MSIAILVLYLLRKLVLAAGVVAAVLFLLAWLVRTRRISPFSGLARAVRGATDPLLAPIERSIVRAGGTPASAPLWGLAAVVIGGIVLISVAEYVVGLVLMLAGAATAGGAALPAALLSLAFGLLQIALLVRVFSSWLPVSPYSPWIRWSYGLTEWILAPLRQVVPNLGGFDITPIIAYYLIRIVGGFLVSAVAGIGR
jgi:YggT family protein